MQLTALGSSRPWRTTRVNQNMLTAQYGHNSNQQSQPKCVLSNRDHGRSHQKMAVSQLKSQTSILCVGVIHVKYASILVLKRSKLVGNSTAPFAFLPSLHVNGTTEMDCNENHKYVFTLKQANKYDPIEWSLKAQSNMDFGCNHSMSCNVSANTASIKFCSNSIANIFSCNRQKADCKYALYPTNYQPTQPYWPRGI